MRQDYNHIGLAQLCGWFGITRQAYYKYNKKIIETSITEHLIVREIQAIRKRHPRIGGRKLYKMVLPFLSSHRIKMGRDSLFSLLASNNLLVKKRKSKVYTTNSFHWLRKYPNLIQNFTPQGINQLWVSDITYWEVPFGNLYISLITDAFSHKVVGYQLAESLKAIETLQALEMAVHNLPSETQQSLIHHSDRGVQYCSKIYVELLKKNNVKISMTQSGDPLDNAIAERINGIIKDEYLMNYKITSFDLAVEKLKQTITLYNQERPHMSIDNLTPEYVHQNNIKTRKLWKNYYKKKRNIVNQDQDNNKTVNSMQD